MASGPITSWQIMGKQWKLWQNLFSWAPKSLQMMTAAVKWKELALWKKSCDLPRQHIKGRYITLPTKVHLVSSVQLLSRVQLFVTLWTAARQASLSITNSYSYSYSCPLSWWCHPTISSSVIPFSCDLPSIFPSIRVFSNDSALLIRWPKY